MTTRDPTGRPAAARRPIVRAGSAARRVGALALLVATVLPPAAMAQAPAEPAPAPAPGTDAALALTAPSPVPVALPLRFVTADGSTVALGGVRHFGTIELVARGEGLRSIAELDLETYLYGLAEMPPRWHEEALKAQAVAARTYAWHSIRLASFDGFDICATTACQVYRGAEIVLEPEHGPRWRAAVAATRGQVLLDSAGLPILARYFSTSGGRTYANEEVFPSSGPRPYLVSIEDPDDAVSPLHRWTVRFTRAEFDAIASRGATLGRVTPVAAAVRVGDVEDPRATIRVTGTNGRRVEVRAIALRDFLSDLAPQLFPGRFPGLRDDGSGPLPTTVPSTRFAIEVTPTEVVLSGRGWGHGVGMGQYGARGRAERGEPYDAILGAYYNGLAPTTSDALPGTIRVGLDPVGTEVDVRADGPTGILDADGTVVAATLGTWRVVRTGEGVTVTPPVGSDAPLEVTATEVVAGAERGTVEVSTRVSRPVLLRLEVTDADGRTVLERDLGLAEAGEHRATWDRREADGSAAVPGTYRVVLVGTDSEGDVGGGAVDVVVPEPPVSALAPPERPGDGPRTGVLVAAGVVLSVLVAVVVLRRRAVVRRRRLAASREVRP